MDAGLKINVGADVSDAIVNIGKLDDSLETLEKDLARIDGAIDRALSQGHDTSALEADFEKVRAKVVALRAEAAKPIVVPPSPPIPAPDDTAFLNTITKQRIAFTDLGRIITGQGFSLRSLASNFALLGPGITIAAAAIYGLVELFSKQSDAEKKAAEEAKKLQEVLVNLKSATEVTETSTGSESGNIARVQALAAAVQDTTKTYKERQNALNELRETNKSYFGDLTLEASSMKLLTDRVKEYSQALITEAVIKGQVEEIAKLSEELQKQVPILDDLAKKHDAYAEVVAKSVSADVGKNTFSGGGGGNLDIIQQQGDLKKVTDEYIKQNDVVGTLKDQIARYTDVLNDNVNKQIAQRPLTVPPGYKDDLKSIIPILEQIKKIYEDINKPSKEPLFKQLSESSNVNEITLIQTQIREAIKKGATEGAKDPAVAKAYADLATALQAKLTHVQNPNLHSEVRGIVDVKAEDVDQVESKIEKAFGGAKGLTIKVPATLKIDLENSGYSKQEQEILLKKAEEDALRGVPPIRWTPAIQVVVNQKVISDALAKQLKESLNKIAAKDITSGFENIGDSIGKAIAGGKNPIEAAGKSILSSLGTLIQDIGKNLIEYGIVKEGLDTVLSAGIALPGVAAIAIGVAAEAIGALVKGTGSSYKAFAEGGIVTGPTMGLIGEAGPEVVFPLDRLNRFVKSSAGSGQQRVLVTGVLRGRDIAIAQARDSKLQNLTS